VGAAGSNSEGTVNELLRLVLRGEGLYQSERSALSSRLDGRHVLEPAICSVSGARAMCAGFLPNLQIKVLHNEVGAAAVRYPLRSQDGVFFSEALGGANSAADEYVKLVAESIAILADRSRDRSMSFAELVECGCEIQALDAQFAQSRIGVPLDSLHQCVGPDPEHPYAKITVCRTTFPVSIGGADIWFFFEKFLVSYSHLDDQGVRRSTVTPIHSHPMNFETVYFTSFGAGSRVIEQEYCLVDTVGAPLVRADGTLDPAFVEAARRGEPPRLRLVEGPAKPIATSTKPIKLEPFESEAILRNHHELIAVTDGLFRPHKVTVSDDPDVATRYFALDNYFGPTGRVFLYGEDAARVWSHDEWDWKR
jgi:hypothetical protein